MKKSTLFKYYKLAFTFCFLSVFLVSCSKEIEPFPDQNSDQIEKRCANLCENLEYTYEEETYNETCCRVTLYVHFTNGCPAPPTVESNGDNIPPSGMDGVNYVYVIESCDSKFITIAGDDGICVELDLECASCCSDTEITSTLLSQSKNCCKYRVVASNGSPCPLNIYGLDSDPLTLNSGSNLSYILEVCKDSRTVSMGTSENEICVSKEISCGCKSITPTIVSSSSGPESDCCTYQLTVTNNANCTAFIFDDNGNVLATIPPLTSILFTIDVCPSDGFMVNLSFGCSFNNICNTISLPLLCEEGD